jgi:hypothetical protein
MAAKKLWIVYQKSATIPYPTTALAALVEADGIDDAITQAINVGNFNHDLEFYATEFEGEPEPIKIEATAKVKGG